MATNHWQLIIGLIIITSLLVVLSFSIGVFVGKRGALIQEFERIKNPQLPTNQQNPKFNQQQSDSQQNNTPRQPDILGRLEEINRDVLLVSTKQGLKQILISADTLFISANQNPIQLEEFKQGDIIGIFGRPSPDIADSYEAVVVIKMTN